jgi:hypothetical protein
VGVGGCRPATEARVRGWWGQRECGQAPICQTRQWEGPSGFSGSKWRCTLWQYCKRVAGSQSRRVVRNVRGARVQSRNDTLASRPDFRSTSGDIHRTLQLERQVEPYTAKTDFAFLKKIVTSNRDDQAFARHPKLAKHHQPPSQQQKTETHAVPCPCSNVSLTDKPVPHNPAARQPSSPSETTATHPDQRTPGKRGPTRSGTP